MTQRIELTLADVKSICHLMETRAGIICAEDRYDQVRQAVEEVMKACDLTDFDAFFARLVGTKPPEEPIQSLVERLVINETFFFRDSGQFSALRDIVLPTIIEERRNGPIRAINIVSAGCSTGEEPYSIAILLHELLHDRSYWNINVIGLDICLSALDRARKATYGSWSFRGVEEAVVNRYFERQNKQFVLSREIRRMVTFHYHNLLNGMPFVDLDLVMWRNVAIYFSADMRRQFAASCFRALRDAGWLFVGASELGQEFFRAHEVVQLPDAIVYRKSENRVPREVPHPGMRPEASQMTPFRSLTLPFGRDAGAPAASASPSFSASVALPMSNGRPMRMPSSSTSRAGESSARVVARIPSEHSYAEAEKLLKRGRVAAAIEMLGEVATDEPRALLLMARIHADQGDNEKAEEVCTSFLVRVPDSPDGYYMLALIRQADKKEALAADALRKAVFLDRDFVMGHWSLGMLYGKLGQPKAAYRHLMTARQLLNDMPRSQTVAHSEGQTAARMLKTADQVLATLGGGKR